MKRSQKKDFPVGRAIHKRGCAWRFAAATFKGVLREEGSSLVEMGLAAVVAFMFLFGIVETSYVLYSYNYVSNAARDASRYAALRGPNSCNDANVTPFPDCG